MEEHLIFISKITEATGITYNKIMEVYKESQLKEHKQVCDLFMERFQLSYGFANTLADIMIDLDKKVQ